MAAPVVLLEARPRSAVDGVASVVRLAGGGAEVPYRYGGEHWRAGIAGLPKIITRLDHDGEQLGGGGVAQAMELRWGASSNAALVEMAARVWADAPVRVWIGPEGEATPPIAADGLVLDTAIDGGMLAIALADQTVDLKRPVLVERYAGTGGIEGPVEFDGQIKPRSWGRCFNVAGRPIDIGANIWVFSDPRRPLLAIDQVRDKGAIPDAATMTTLEWQGSAEATFAALRAAPAVQGGGVVAPSIACVKWWTQPAGDLRADIRGETEGGYVETAPAIVGRIVTARSAIPVPPAAIAAAVAARPAPFGWRVESDGVTAADTVSEMLAGVSLSWVLVNGSLVFRPWDWTAPTRAARSQGVSRRSTFKPVAGRKIGYRRNWSPMARGDLAAIVLVKDVLYEDGRPLADVVSAVLLRLDRVASDGWLSAGEKPAERIAYQALNDDWAAKRSLAMQYEGGDAAIGAARVGADDAIYALGGYLFGLVPFWLDTNGDTPINPAAYRDAWSLAYRRVAELTARLSLALGPGLAALTGRVDRVASDNWLSAGEKPAERIAFQALSDDWSALRNKSGQLNLEATNPAIGVARVAADDAMYALGGYLGSLTPYWLDTAVDTPIVAADYRATWSLAYQRVAALNAAITGQPGAAGADGFIADSDVPVFVIECFANGTPKPTWTGGSGAIRLTKGGGVITAGVTYSVGSQQNTTSLALNGATFSFSGLAADTGQFVINAIYNGVAYSRVISVKKVRDGSAAFRSEAPFSSNADAASGGGNTTVPQGRTVTISAYASYFARSPGAGQSVGARGYLSLYWRNVTDGGPDNLLGTLTGSDARSVNRSNNPSEPEIEATPGEVSGSFSFTSPSPDKQIAYRADFSSGGSAGFVAGNVALEIR